MFTLTCPWVLILLPLPWVIRRMLPEKKSYFAQAVCVPFFDDVQKMNKKAFSKVSRRYDTGVFYVIWTLLLLALSGPVHTPLSGGKPQVLERHGHNIMLVLDLSSSMQVNDMQKNHRMVSRLSVVKEAARQFVQARTSDKIGLILFGTRAYLQTPLTYDKQNILMRLDEATVGLAGNTTSIGDALGLAVKRLQHAPKKGRVIILLTDGANNSGVLSPEQAASLAKTQGTKVYTIGLSSDLDPQSFGGLFLRMNAALDLDEDALRNIAKLTNGRYFRATDMRSLQTIYDTINQLETVENRETVIQVPMDEYYPWPLALALCLCMGWLLQRRVTS